MPFVVREELLEKRDSTGYDRKQEFVDRRDLEAVLADKRGRLEDTMERNVYPGEFYRHFKNKLYQIVAVAEHTETGERMVVYQALYGDYRVYVRPYDMFVSEVDHGKYPDVGQQYRFERVVPGQPAANDGRSIAADGNAEGSRPDAEQEHQPHPALLRFLEEDTFEKRMECLKQLSSSAAQSDLDSLYVVLDMRPLTGSIREQTEGIAQYLAVQNRYDGSHLR